MAHAHLDVTELDLATFAGSVAEIEVLLHRADAFLLLSGVYCNSFGSPLQRLIEVATQ